MYELGDTLSNKYGGKFIVIMTFFVSKSLEVKSDKKSLGGFWACKDNMKHVVPFYLDKKSFNSLNNSLKSLENFETQMTLKRSRCLLVEKDFNVILQKKTAKKFASILLTHL
jgi:hypothetical protein